MVVVGLIVATVGIKLLIHPLMLVLLRWHVRLISIAHIGVATHVLLLHIRLLRHQRGTVPTTPIVRRARSDALLELCVHVGSWRT